MDSYHFLTWLPVGSYSHGLYSIISLQRLYCDLHSCGLSSTQLDFFLLVYCLCGSAIVYCSAALYVDAAPLALLCSPAVRIVEIFLWGPLLLPLVQFVVLYSGINRTLNSCSSFTWLVLSVLPTPTDSYHFHVASCPLDWTPTDYLVSLICSSSWKHSIFRTLVVVRCMQLLRPVLLLSMYHPH
jgi:hypothetical protein